MKAKPNLVDHDVFSASCVTAYAGWIIALLIGWNTSATTLLVWPDSPSPAPPFITWNTAAHSIQDAVDAAQAGDTVRVTNGVYATGGRLVHWGLTNRVVVDKPILVQSVNGPAATAIKGAPPLDQDTGYGAVACVQLGTNAVLSGFTLTNGYAPHSYSGTFFQGEGGGAFCADSAALTNCVIVGNRAFTHGGGVSGGTLYNCVLKGNWAPEGGGVYGSTLRLCTLTDNLAQFGGGGASESTLMNCLLAGNSAHGDNDWEGSGGGAYGCTLYNCTVTGNSASYEDGGVCLCKLYNSIVFFNSATTEANANYDEPYDIPGGPSSVGGSTFNYCCTTPLPSVGSNNFTLDPRLASASHLSADSPCRGAGSVDYSTGSDIDGDPWASPPSVGCDEYVTGAAMGPLSTGLSASYTNVAPSFPLTFTASIDGYAASNVWDFGDGVLASNRLQISHAWSAPGVYPVIVRAFNQSWPNGVSATVPVQVSSARIHCVDAAGTNPVPPYVSWATAASNIQDAVDVAQNGEKVLVSNGVYATGARGVPGTMTNRIVIQKEILVQSIHGPAVTVIEGAPPASGGNGDDAIRCVYLGAHAVLNGFTLTNGHGAYSYAGEYAGGGAWCGDFAILTNCIIAGNSAYWKGGGVYRGTLFNCVLDANSTVNGGGAYGSTLYNCTLKDNSAENYGGGAYECTVFNCAISGNSSILGGGAYNSDLHNCTVTGNSGCGASGGSLENCIVYFNSGGLTSADGKHYPITYNYTDTTRLNYCCTTPLPDGGIGNFDKNPQLASASHLSADSPCIGAGSARFVSGTDIDGEPWASPPSIGCDEFTAGAATGALQVATSASYTNVALGFTVEFNATVGGYAAANTWDFGDGVVVSNEAWATSHTWTTPGTYPVVLRAFNETWPEGVSATVTVQVAEQPIHYVNAASTNPVPPYFSWTTAATTIQDAVDAAFVNGTVLVTNGDYAVGGRALCQCQWPPEWSTTNRVVLDKPLTVRSVNGPEVTVIKGASSPEGAIRCVYLGGDTLLDGFRLTNGYADSSGGGALCAGSAILTNCIVVGNSAGYAGGGVEGGILYNCIVAGNSASYAGGGVDFGTLYNCVVAGNSASSIGGGVYHSTLRNCIVYFNSAPSGVNYSNTSTFNYSCTTPLPPDGTGNITNAPLFVNTNGWNDLHLRFGSPGIDAGTNLSAILSADLEGNPRPLDGNGDGVAAFDMGAYEFDARSIIPQDWFASYGLDASDPQVVSENPDHDPYTTFQEWIADTDPTNASSFFHIESFSKHFPATVLFRSSSNRSYTLWSTLQLASPDWTPVPTEQAIPGTGGTLILSDPTAAPKHFYHVEVNVP